MNIDDDSSRLQGGFMEKKQVFIMLGVVVAITLGISLYCIFFGNQYLIKFDSNGGTSVSNQFVRVGNKVQEPETPIREGYEFIEWQLNGKTYDFSSKVRRKFTLVAQWRRIVDAADILYKVVFDSNGGSEVEMQEVSPGEKVLKPTDPVRDGYQFEGWFYGDSKFDFSKVISKDTTLKAKWKQVNNSNSSNNEKPNTNKPNKKPEEDKSKPNNVSTALKEGDRVRIVGEYAESSTSKKARHKRAIGWKRIVLKVYEDREYPYRVGDTTGTTGFFKADSLEKID